MVPTSPLLPHQKECQDLAGAASLQVQGKLFGVIYQQIHGTAMGSPVSVVIANLVMEAVEEGALETFAPPLSAGNVM